MWRPVAVFFFFATALPAHGQVVNYSNVTGFQGAHLPNGGAQIGGLGVTTLIADDIQLDFGASPYHLVRDIQVSVVNGNAAARSVAVLLRFYDDDGLAGSPGTLIASADISAQVFNPGLNFASTSVPTIFMPLDGKFWAGVAFGNQGTATSAAELDQFGPGFYNPPTLGSSSLVFFQSTATGTFLGNNPGGFINPTGLQGGNFGWQFAVVPEPTTWALLGLGTLGVVPLYRRWRQARQAQANALRLFSKK